MAEAVLHRSAGGPAVMCEQLNRLIEASEVFSATLRDHLVRVLD
jgi:hypothetical protein